MAENDPSLTIVFADASNATLKDVGSVLWDLTLLHELWVVDSVPEYSTYEFSSYFWTRRGRPVRREHELVVASLTSQSPIELITWIPYAVVGFGVATGLVSSLERLVGSVERVVGMSVRLRSLNAQARKDEADADLREMDVEDRRRARIESPRLAQSLQSGHPAPTPMVDRKARIERAKESVELRLARSELQISTVRYEVPDPRRDDDREPE